MECILTRMERSFEGSLEVRLCDRDEGRNAALQLESRDGDKRDLRRLIELSRPTSLVGCLLVIPAQLHIHSTKDGAEASYDTALTHAFERFKSIVGFVEQLLKISLSMPLCRCVHAKVKQP